MYTAIQSPILPESKRREFLSKVGKNLRVARVTADFNSQSQAATALGCSHDRICRAEAGKDIRISDLLEYAIAYKCDIKKFFE